MTRTTKRVGVALAVACSITASASASETVNGETYTYQANCRTSPGVSKGPGQSITYLVEADSTAMSSDVANPAISTGVVCVFRDVDGSTMGRIGITHPGGRATWAGTVTLPPTGVVEVCASMSAVFLNGYGGSSGEECHPL